MSSVTVIIPARNAADTIAEAACSVLANPEVSELIVIDDCSIDGTSNAVSCIADPRVKMLHGQGSGIAAALNLGISTASGDFVARCDADDLFPENRIAWQLGWLNNHPEYIAVSAGFRSLTKTGTAITDLACSGDGREVTKDLLSGNSVTSLCTWLTRRSALLATGGAREWFATGEDLDLMYRLALQGRIWHAPRVAYMYRLHDASIIHTQPNTLREFYERCAKDFAEQRMKVGTDDLERGRPPDLPEVFDSEPARSTEQIVSHYIGGAWSLHSNGKRWEAVFMIASAIMQYPNHLQLWVHAAKLLVKPTQKSPVFK